jgi:hypothetical protein
MADQALHHRHQRELPEATQRARQAHLLAAAGRRSAAHRGAVRALGDWIVAESVAKSAD